MDDVDWFHSQRRMWTTARKRAKAKGLLFTIKPADIPIPQGFLCPVLQVPLKRHKGVMERNTPSLDRVDNLKGYEPGNVRVVSWWANYLKSNLLPDQIENMLKYSRGEI